MAELRDCGPVPARITVRGEILDDIRGKIARVEEEISNRCTDEQKEILNPMLFKIEDMIEDILWPDND